MKNKMKHTQGEWLIDCTDKAILNSPEQHYTIISKSNLPIAFVRMGGVDNIPYSVGEGEANLKLIAAAPLMLKEHLMDLQHLKSWKKQLIDAGLRGSVMYQEYLDMITAKEEAIKKATK